MGAEEEMLEALEVVRRPKVANPFVFEFETPFGGLVIVAQRLDRATFRSKDTLRFEGQHVRIKGKATKGSDGKWVPEECETSLASGLDFVRLVGHAKMASLELGLSRNLTKALTDKADLLVKREIVALFQERKELDEAIDQVCMEIDRRQQKFEQMLATKDRLAVEHAAREVELKALLKSP